MSKYTVSIHELIEYFTREEVESWFKDYKLEDYLSQDKINTITQYNVWNKDKLASMIVDHYFMREIGYETPVLFKHFAKTKMREIMGYYAELIYSASIEYDPLVNVDYTETIGRTTSNSGQSTSTGSSSGLAINSDTPQGQINKNDILEGRYATSTSASESTGTSNDNASSEGKEDILRHRKGNEGITATMQKLIEQYRDNILNINYDIIKELKDLFIGLL